jgi:AmmeMemoRadiSam system radical SAM enzyme/AmmeMemoRadiSam system protein B/AmmeMemoRadiSam system protein A
MSRIVTWPPPAPAYADGARLGGWWHEEPGSGRMVCDLCPRACTLKPGDRGFCFVRENRDGEMVLSTYGKSTGFCIDPIEKKPLNHFYPGTSVLSFGTAGCNLGCKFCQNWSISKSREIEQLSESATPEAIAAAARELGCRSVAFTYNDPVIWAEYAIDTAKACRAAGVKSVAVTAGYITPEARGAFYEYMDAANVDLKGFTEEFYQKLTLSHLQPVLDTLRWLKHETDVWFEITNLIIPEANDDRDDLRRMCDWILTNLGDEVPLHFTAFHPDFRLNDRQHTPAQTLFEAYDIANSLGLKYVYAGNVHAPKHQATYCPSCKKPVIERVGYELPAYRLRDGACEHCGTKIAGRFDRNPGKWGSRRMPVRISQWQKASGAGQGSRDSDLVQISPARPRPSAETAKMTVQPDFSSSQDQAILQAAAEILTATVEGRAPQLADPQLAGAADQLVLGAFVTAKRQGKLRGCCGSFGKPVPLIRAVEHAAQRTATDDPRFPPISREELPFLDLDVWLLSNEQSVAVQGEARADAVEIGKHGLQIARGEQRGLLLPGVATEHQLSAEQFLEHVCLKAGLPPTAWKEADTQLWTFEGHEIQGRLADLVQRSGLTSVPAYSPADLQPLVEFARSNLLAAATGAAATFYSPLAKDGSVHGIVLGLLLPSGQLLQSTRVTVREELPLQSTLYHLASQLGRNLPRQPRLATELASLPLSLAILTDPSLQGTLAHPDLRGVTPDRALMLLQRDRSVLLFELDLAPEELLQRAAELGKFPEPEQAAVLSLAIASTEPRLTVVQTPQPQEGNAVRPPAHAGSFYPASAIQLAANLDALLDGPPIGKHPWPAVMVPHAGWMYSGQIAAQTLRRVEIPDTVIILSPKHTPRGVDWAVAPHRRWAFPGGDIASDPDLIAELVQAIPGLQPDAAAHAQEHGIEVELPILARLAPDAKVVGIALGSGSFARCQQFAQGLAKVLQSRKGRTLLVISSDMNHFASDAENRRLDALALDCLDRLDAEALYNTCQEKNISMCGLVPAVIVLETLKRLGELSQAERVAYSTSADVSGDTSRVVGYAGMLFGP